LTDVVSRNNNANEGIEIEAENVTVENSVAEGAEDTGLDIAAGSDGTVVIRESTSSGNGNGDYNMDEDGIVIESTKELIIEDTKTVNNYDAGIAVSANSVAAGGRTISFSNITSQANGGDGAVISGTTDTDDVSVTNSSIERNYDGLDIMIETATVSQTRISNNSDVGVRFAGAFTGGSINRSSILNNGGLEIANNVDGVTVDATNNWWGNPAGPDESDIEGGVLTENPLTAPPGETSQRGPDEGAIQLTTRDAPETIQSNSTFNVTYDVESKADVETAFTLESSVNRSNISVTDISGDIQSSNLGATPPSASTDAVTANAPAVVIVEYQVAVNTTGGASLTTTARDPISGASNSTITNVNIGAQDSAPETPRERALQIAGKQSPDELEQDDITIAITQFERGQQANQIAIGQDDVTTLITLFERSS
jgi:hypothetical protein